MESNLQLAALLAHLTVPERLRLAASSKAIDRLERIFKDEFAKRIRQLDTSVFADLFDHGRFPESSVDFLPLVLEHSYRVLALGMRSAEDDLQGAEVSMSGKPPSTRVPRSLRELKELYDQWKRVKAPPRQAAIAEDLRKAYLKRVQSVWEKYGDDFRKGKEFTPARVRDVLRDRGDMARARAETIVQTETTHYYNKARRTIYERSPDVTHFLFVAIRDRATTAWCRSRQGVVFEKGTALFLKNVPPCHWNCRSEILPLTAQNPRHRVLIYDRNLRAENRALVPLPSGWNRR